MATVTSSNKDFQVFLRLLNGDSEKRAVEKETKDEKQVLCRLVQQEDQQTVQVVPFARDRAEVEGDIPETSKEREKFHFDTVFSVEDDNSAVYKGAVRDVVDSTLLGYHGTVIAIGEYPCEVLKSVRPPKNNHGAIFRASEQIFNCIERSRAKTGLNLVVLCSFIAISEERSFDVLAPIVAGKSSVSSPPELTLVNGHLHGLSQCEARSTSQVKKFLTSGRKQLQKLQTTALAGVHTVFTFTVEHAKLGHSFAPVSGTLNMVDVAYGPPQPSGKEQSSPSSLEAFVSKILNVTKTTTTEQSHVLPGMLHKKLSGDNENDTPLMSLLGGALGGNCKTSFICHVPENQSDFKKTMSLLHLSSLASCIENHPDKRDLAQQALMAAYLRELGITKMVLEKGENQQPVGGGEQFHKNLVSKKNLLSSSSGSRLRDVEDTDVYVDGRHLLDPGDEEDNREELKTEPATVEAVASALAAAVMQNESDNESPHSEDDNPPVPSPVVKYASEMVTVSHLGEVEGESDENAPHEMDDDEDGTKERDTGNREVDFKLKSAKTRVWKEEKSLPSPVHDACTTREALSVEMLLSLLQDPDSGAQRALVSKDVRLRKDSGGLFSGHSIVKWMIETLHGVNSEQDAETLGQLLLDKGGIFHSEGSSVFLDAESLFYYARIGRADPKMLSEAEIQSLLGKTPAGPVTVVDPQENGKQKIEPHSTSDGKVCEVELWNETAMSPPGVKNEVPGSKDPTWVTTDVHLNGKYEHVDGEDKWNSTSVDKHGGVNTSDTRGDIKGSTRGDTRGSTRGDTRGSTRGDTRGSTRGDTKGGPEERHSSGTAEVTHSQRPSSKKKSRKKSAHKKRNSKESLKEPVLITVDDEDRIKFFDNSEEVPPPPLSAGSQNRDMDDYSEYTTRDDHHHGDYHGNQQYGNSLKGDFVDDVPDTEVVVGSEIDLVRHRSMLLGTDMADWSADQVLAYESQLALNTSTGLVDDVEDENPELTEDGENKVARKHVDKYSAKPNFMSFDKLTRGVEDFKPTDYPTPLHLHAATGNNAGVLRELVMMYGVNTTDPYGRSPLMFAIFGNKVAACSSLIDCGANVNQGAVNGVTPLHLAAYFGLKDILNLLLRKGGVVGSVDVEGRNAIHYSTIPESTTCLRILLRNAYDSAINASDNNYLTPLHWAISRDHYRHILVLVKKGGVVTDIVDEQGRTFLNYAICCAANNSFEELLSTSPQLLATCDSTLTTPLHLACAHPSVKFLDCIFNHAKSSTLDINCEDNVGRTPLHYAAICNRVPAVKELLRRGGRTDMVDQKNRTPLDYALKHGEDCEMVQIFQSPSSRKNSAVRTTQKSSVCIVL